MAVASIGMQNMHLTNTAKRFIDESVLGPLHSSSLNTGVNQRKLKGPDGPLSLSLDTAKKKENLYVYMKEGNQLFHSHATTHR